MDEVRQSIKEYVQVLTLNIEEPVLDFVVEDVVNRFLVYTNRIELLDDESEQPVPDQVITTLARVVVSVCADVQAEIKNEREVERIKDGDQEVTFGQKAASYLHSTADEELFSGVKQIFDKFRIASVRKYEPSSVSD